MDVSDNRNTCCETIVLIYCSHHAHLLCPIVLCLAKPTGHQLVNTSKERIFTLRNLFYLESSNVCPVTVLDNPYNIVVALYAGQI